MKVKQNEAFFDEVSSFYDGMIGFDNALKRRQELLNRFLDVNVRSAADLGCGSGLDSIAMAQNGVEVTAFDQSSGMIEQAKRNAEGEELDIRFVKSALDKIPKSFNSKFDLVLSLGNTLANLEPSKLKTALSRIKEILKPGGKAVIQILNYSAILKNQERIINITEQNGETFVRFYDFYQDHLNFNILKFMKDNPKQRTLLTTILYPYDQNQFTGIIKQTGFATVKVYGNLKLEKFQKYKSSDLVITAQ